MKFLKIVSVIVLIPVILFAGALAFLKFADLNNYRSDAEKLLRKYAGVDVEIKGNMDVGVSLKPSLELNDVYVYDPESKFTTARIGRALVQIAVMPLFHKEVVIEKVQTENTEIFYDGENSVLINELDMAADDYSSPVNIAFDTTVAGTDIYGTLQTDSLEELKKNGYDGGNIKADITALGYNLKYGGKVENVWEDIRTSGGYELLYKNSKVAGNLEFKLLNGIPDLKMNIDGDNIYVKDFTEQKQASSGWLIGSAYAEEYIPGTQIPYEYLRMLNADITLDVKQIDVDENIVLKNVKGNISLKDGVLKSNVQNVSFKNNVLSGSAEIKSPTAKPYIKLNIKGDGFDIRDFTGESGQKKNNKKISLGFLIAPAYAAQYAGSSKIPYEYLKIADADVNLSLKAVTYGNDFKISAVSASAALKNSVLKINIANISAGGGKVSGSATVNASKQTAALYLKGANIVLQNLYIPFGQPKNEVYISSGGNTTFEADLNTYGSTYDSYMNNVSGQVIAFADSSVLNIRSLDKLQGNIIVQILDMAGIKASSGNMSLKCAVVRSDIKQGLMHFPKGIAFNADNFYLVADGRINLRDDKINLDLQPFSGKIRDVNISSVLGNLIKIKGTLNNPKIAINQTSTAKNIIGALASGGAYNVGDMMLSADGSPCHTALTGTKYADRFKADNSVRGSVGRGYNNTKDAIGDLAKGVKDQTKGLKNSAKEIKNQLKGLFK